MNLARILYPVRVLGPGDRVGLWLCGCSRGCRGCSNPELWHRKPEYEVTPEAAFSLIRRIAAEHPIDGFTLSGGEPMDQAADVAALIDLMKTVSDDILIYSGYRIEELRDRGDPATDRILREAAVLIDGAYVEELNDGAALRGSSNQRVHLLAPRHAERYRLFFAEARNRIQNFTTADGVVSVGIHRPTFQPETARARESAAEGPAHRGSAESYCQEYEHG